MTKTKRKSRSRENSIHSKGEVRQNSVSPIRNKRNLSRGTPGNRYRKNKNNSNNKNSIQNQFLSQLKRNKWNIHECKAIVENASSKGVANGKVGRYYLGQILKYSRNDHLKLKFSEDYIQTLIDTKSSCDSNTFYEWVLIQRNCGQIKSSEYLLEAIRKLNIHRPSFKLLASMITTYCTFAIRCVKTNRNESIRYAMYSRDVFDEMKDKYKYVPNTYLINSVLNMYVKLHLSELFWNLVIICSEIKLVYDAFTYGSLLEMCLKEENYNKFEDVFRCFRRKCLTFQETEGKNIQYVNTLFERMKEKKRLKEMKGRNNSMSWDTFIYELSNSNYSEKMPKKLEEKKNAWSLSGNDSFVLETYGASCD